MPAVSRRSFATHKTSTHPSTTKTANPNHSNSFTHHRSWFHESFRPSRFHLRDSRQLLVPLEWRRHFSSSGNRGGRGYGGNSGRFSQRGSGLGRPEPNNRNKENFNKRFTEPAARGELTKHQSLIPKLAGRKNKSNSFHHTNRATIKASQNFEDEGQEDDNENTFDSEGEQTIRKDAQSPISPVLDLRPEAPGMPPKFMSQDDDYLALDELWDDKKYYWNEEEFDSWVDASDEADKPAEFFDEDGNLKYIPYTDEDLKPQPHDWLIDEDEEHERFMAEFNEWKKTGEVTEEGALPPASSSHSSNMNPNDFAAGEKADQENAGTEEEEGDTEVTTKEDLNKLDDAEFWARARSFKPPESKVKTEEEEEEVVDPEERFFNAENDIFEIAKREDEEFPDEVVKDPAVEQFNKMVLPLQDTFGEGDTAEDFVEAMQNHPTDYASVTHKAVHPNSRREPRPTFSKSKKHIQQPSLEFVETFKRFLYVTGLPPLTVDGTEGDIENPIHRSLLEKTVSDLVGVETTHISVANASSAFVGFDSPRALANAIKDGPSSLSLTKVPVLRKYDPAAILKVNDTMDEFVESAESPDYIVHISDLPFFNTPQSVARQLIPADSELSNELGVLSVDDVFILSPGNALVRLPSAEKANNILVSSLIQNRLEEIGTYPVHYLRARRELLHDGFHYKTHEIRVNGPRLVVDGIHIPSKQFYISHASALKIHDMDPQFLDEEFLTRHFQQFSKSRRLKSSIEFVRCEISGKPILATAYIGFEETEEARNCVESCKGRMRIGDRHAKLRVLVDRGIPHVKLDPEVRSRRSLEELEDDLHNWQKHVDPADIEYLDKNGVPRVALNNMMVYVRRKNSYFGVLDGNFRDESVEPDKPMGAEYKELVQETVKILKAGVVTREDPGETYLNQFLVDEEPDLKIFDMWDKEKVEIDKVFSKYKIGQI